MTSTQIIDVLIAIVAVAVVMVRQVQPRPVIPRKMLVLPVVLILIGISELSKAVPHGQSFTSTDVTWLAVDLAVGVVSGIVRAFTVRLFEQDGVLWRQGGAATIVAWVASIAARLVVGVVGGHAGAAKVLDDGLLLSFGVSLVCQYALVCWRGAQLGIPFATRDAGGTRFQGRR